MALNLITENPEPFDGAKYVGESTLSTDLVEQYRNVLDNADEGTKRVGV